MIRVFFFTIVISSFPRMCLAEDVPAIDFNRQIRPILSDTCFQCHGPDAESRQTELRFDREENTKEDRGGYAVIVPGKPDESELIRRITSTDEFERMPPEETGKHLTAEQIELFREWVKQGAKWSQHWAYETPIKSETPEVKNIDWPINWIDHFILANIEKRKLKPTAEADRVTLIRRLSFDLTGLPPSPDDVDTFANSTDNDAYEQLVDRLLASSAFGERMAIYWLDLVRYADTVGYHGDQDHNISPYRDYVITSFNDNLPFDRFTREQLAGDLLPDAGVDEIIASGYNRLLQTSHEGGVQPKEYLAIYAADRVRNLSAVWLGGTLGCAQCHDHKFDPYTAKDFYSMAAFFADIDEAQHFKRGSNALPTARPPEIKVLTKRERELIAQLEAEIDRLKRQRDSLAEDDDSRSSIDAEIADRNARVESVKDSARKTMITSSISPRTMRILPRGNWLDESGPIVQPAVPEFLGTLKTGEERATRLDLARWLTDADHGAGLLTARVFANRFWYLFFGRGLSESLDDFGGQGQPPVQPVLLDRLAHEFVESEWDVKHLVKLIVMSRTYQQSSVPMEQVIKADPNNDLFGRQGRFRLPAEMVRDNALAISGLLVQQEGGASAKPYQPAGYYRHLNFPIRKYQHHADDRQWRRGVYVHWQRQFLHPALRALDAPNREECTAARPRSNTPLASLVLLNDPTYVEAARVFAQRVLNDGGETTDSRLDLAFRLAVSRKPDLFERGILTRLLEDNRAVYDADPESATQLLNVGLAPVDEKLDQGELAGWTAVCRAILNLSETNTRN